MARGKRSAAKAITKDERQIVSLRLRQQGKAYRDIAAKTGVSLRQAFDDVNAALEELKAVTEVEAEKLRALEVARLDAIMEKVYEAAVRGNLTAVDRYIKIAERRARLLGIDAPARTDFTSDNKPVQGIVIVEVVKSSE